MISYLSEDLEYKRRSTKGIDVSNVKEKRRCEERGRKELAVVSKVRSVYWQKMVKKWTGAFGVEMQIRRYQGVKGIDGFETDNQRKNNKLKIHVREKLLYVLNIRNTVTNKHDTIQFIKKRTMKLTFYRPFILHKEMRAVTRRYYKYLTDVYEIKVNKDNKGELELCVKYNHNAMLKYVNKDIIRDKQDKRCLDKRFLPLCYYPKRIQNMHFEIDNRPISAIDKEDKSLEVLKEFNGFFKKNVNQQKKKHLKFNILTKSKYNNKRKDSGNNTLKVNGTSLRFIKGNSTTLKKSFRISSRSKLSWIDPYALKQPTNSIINTKISLPEKANINSSLLKNKIRRKILSDMEGNFGKARLKESLGKFFNSRNSLDQSINQIKKKKKTTKPIYVRLDCPTININDNLKDYSCKSRTCNMIIRDNVKDYKGVFKTGKLKNNFFVKKPSKKTAKRKRTLLRCN